MTYYHTVRVYLHWPTAKLITWNSATGELDSASEDLQFFYLEVTRVAPPSPAIFEHLGEL